MMDEEVGKAAEQLLGGRVILYPTDTIWGIGCDATNREAVQKIYEIKKRSDTKSMLVLVSGTGMLKQHIRKIPKKALEILRTSTRPTTIIYPEAIHLASNLPAEDGSIGIRVTNDPFCRKLIEIAGVPIVSTSANISGRRSPASFHEIGTEILEQVDHVVEWRQHETEFFSPSRIIRLDLHGNLTVLRP